ncbi:Bacteriocin-protection, YdeI or OmpD-Associated [compost metagenome]
MASNELDRVEVASRAELRAWLETHHAQTSSVWLVTWKKAAGTKHLSYDEVVDEALCFGWVDSTPRSLDAERSMRLLSPRRPKSAWSAVNKQRIERLIASGLMQSSGIAKIEAARKDGSWSCLDAVEALQVPTDLTIALAGVLDAARNFEGCPRSTKRAILEWILHAKTPETRAKRIDETAVLAGRNIRANQARQPKTRTIVHQDTLLNLRRGRSERKPS